MVFLCGRFDVRFLGRKPPAGQTRLIWEPEPYTSFHRVIDDLNAYDIFWSTVTMPEPLLRPLKLLMEILAMYHLLYTVFEQIIRNSGDQKPTQSLNRPSMVAAIVKEKRDINCQSPIGKGWTLVWPTSDKSLSGALETFGGLYSAHGLRCLQ